MDRGKPFIMWDYIIACKSSEVLKCVYFSMRLLQLELAENVILVICNLSVVQMIWCVHDFLRFLSISK